MNAASEVRVKSNTAKSIFPTSLSLVEYIRLVSNTQNLLIRETDPTIYVEFCKSIVIIPDFDGQVPEFDIEETSRETVSIKTTINRVIAHSVKTHSGGNWRRKNILALGYRSKSEGWSGKTGADVKEFPEIQSQYTNTVHSLLTNQTMPWQMIANRLGDSIFRHVLTLPLFIPSSNVEGGGNGSYVQLSGTPVGEFLHNSQNCGTLSGAEPLKPRVFVDRRKELMGQIEKAPIKDVPKALLESLQVRGKTQLPRYAIFYKYFGERTHVLSTQHLMHKSSTNGALLANHAFGLVKSISGMRDKTVMSDDSTLGVEIRHQLQQLMEGVLQKYKLIDVGRALQHHCPKTESAESTDNKCAQTTSQKLKKKRTRGCRGGRAEKSRRDSLLSQAPIPQAIAPIVPLEHIEQNKKRILRGRGRRKTVTVGDRLLSRMLAHTSAEAIFRDDGFHSQDNTLIPPPINLVLQNQQNVMECVPSQNSMSSSLRVEDRDSHSFFSLEPGTSQNPVEPDVYDGDYDFPLCKKQCLMPSKIFSQNSDLNDAVPLSSSSAPCSDNAASTSTTITNTISPVLSAPKQDCGLAHHLFRPLLTQASTSASISSLLGIKRPLPPPPGQPTSATSYISLCVPVKYVSAFACSICRHTFPISFWGSRHNLDAFLSSVARYIRLGQHETLTIEQVAYKLCAREIPWLNNLSHAVETSIENTTVRDSDADNGEDSPLSKSLSTTLVLQSFMYWVFSQLLNPLLSCCFYCTEAEGRGSGAAAEVLYFHKSVWSKIVQMGAQQMSRQFMAVLPPSTLGESEHPIAKRRRLVQSRLLPSIRFVPKATSLRPITNLRGASATLHNSLQDKRTAYSGTSSDGHIVNNKALQGSLNVLTRICNSSPLHIGFGLSSLNHAYAKMRRFRSVLEEAAQGTPKYYVAVCDLEKCYDNVKTALLYDLVKDLLSNAAGADEEDGGFVVHKYTVTHYQASMEKPFTKKLKFVTAFGEKHKFEEAVPLISQKFRSSVIADQVVYDSIPREEVLQKVRAHLFNHMVTLPIHEKDGCTKRFTQVTGIPQGSVLSPLLCNLYYGNAERQIFGSDEQVRLLGLLDKSLILRWMDDYIMISTDQQCVKHFLQRAHQCLTPFGGGINPSKTRVNFDCSVELDGKKCELQQIPEDDIAWCGLLLDTRNLEIKINFWKKLLEFPLSASGSRAEYGHSLRRVMKTYVRMKANAIVLDATLNSRSTVICTIFQMFLVTAMRTHCLLKKMGAGSISSTVRHNAIYLFRCVNEAVLFGARLIHSRTTKNWRVRTGVLSFDDDDVMNENAGMNTRDGTVFAQYILNSTSVPESTTGLCAVDHKTCIWLGLKAFAATFSRRKSVYNEVLIGLKYKGVGLERSLNAQDLDAIKNTLLSQNSSGLLDRAIWM